MTIDARVGLGKITMQCEYVLPLTTTDATGYATLSALRAFILAQENEATLKALGTEEKTLLEATNAYLSNPSFEAWKQDRWQWFDILERLYSWAQDPQESKHRPPSSQIFNLVDIYFDAARIGWHRMDGQNTFALHDKLSESHPHIYHRLHSGTAGSNRWPSRRQFVHAKGDYPIEVDLPQPLRIPSTAMYTFQS
jgi:hypothetical protein